MGVARHGVLGNVDEEGNLVAAHYKLDVHCGTNT